MSTPDERRRVADRISGLVTLLDAGIPSPEALQAARALLVLVRDNWGWIEAALPRDGGAERMRERCVFDDDTSFMIGSAVRYCLGRHTYAPSLCADWLKKNWYRLAPGYRAGILKDIDSHIADELCSQTGTWDIDLETWRNSAIALRALPLDPEHGGLSDGA